MLKLSSSRGIRIDAPVLSVSWSFEDHSVIIQALRKGLIEHEASDTGGVPRWKSSCPDRLAEATANKILFPVQFYAKYRATCSPVWPERGTVTTLSASGCCYAVRGHPHFHCRGLGHSDEYVAPCFTQNE